MRVSVSFCWYDMWMGAYIDTKGRTLYICLVPCIVIKVWRGREEETEL